MTPDYHPSPDLPAPLSNKVQAGEDLPWWWPVPTDEKWLARIRSDYPEEAHWTDEALRDHFADGRRYQFLADHIRDAYDQFEHLADAFLKLNPKDSK